MGNVFLYRNAERIIGSVGLVWCEKIDIKSVRDTILELNSKRLNFPHQIADSFKFCNSQLIETSQLINLN
jgi:hypothetical protein